MIRRDWMDYIVRAVAADQQIRAFAATTKDLVETARGYHNTSPVATAALGRLLTAGAMMGAMMKGEKDLLTLQIGGDGPIGGITVTADSAANVKGYVNHPGVYLPATAKGKLDVGGAVGNGVLRVIRDLGMKEPYIGQSALQTGEIGDDLTYYFAMSEQVPSSVGLGVLLERNVSLEKSSDISDQRQDASLQETSFCDSEALKTGFTEEPQKDSLTLEGDLAEVGKVRQAGGFIIQLMPFTPDEVIDRLEQKLAEVRPVTTMLEAGMSPEQILEELLGEFHLEILDKIPTQYHCDCSRERIERVLISLGKKELEEMIADGEPIEVNCQFCDKKYRVNVEELRKLLKISQRP
ncbi:MAG: Hsp33 family molecular chaperone HslO [Lachnospiraceae bacterium]|nr:Hsp33 family molecular chaperone HslO [Lachnospiraceae bacterium]